MAKENLENVQRWTAKRRAALVLQVPKDLRDTFASHLLTCGIGPENIARWMGHQDIRVLRDHYAEWIEDDDGVLYGEPERLRRGEVPSDLLARVAIRDPRKAAL